MNKYILIAVFLTSCFLRNSIAQDKIELTLDEAVKHALTHNKQLKGAAFGKQEAKMAHLAAITQGLPQAEAVYDYQNFFNAEANIGPMTFVFNPTSNLNFRASQLLFSGNYIVGLQMAKLYREMADINYEKTDAEIRAQVINSYNLILISMRSKDILEQNVLNIEDVLSRTKALVTVGILDETDTDQISVQKMMLANSVRTADRQLELATNLLRMHLGISTDTEIILKDDLLKIMALSDVEASINKIFEIEKNHDIQLMLLQKNMAGKQLLMERVKFLPTAAGFYNYTEKIKKTDLDFQPKTVIGLNVSIPLFSSGTRYLNQAKAKYNLLNTENQVEMVKEQLLIQEKQLRYNLKNALEQYKAQNDNVQLSRRVYNNLLLKYQQGMVSSLDVTTANSNVLQAENGYNVAIMQVLEAKTALDKLLNK